MSTRSFCLIGMIGFVCTTPALAQQERALSELYGEGVHAYFARDYARSDVLLSQAVAAESKDPRVYYFRAMARLRMGRSRDAEGDMRIGAELESRDTDGYFAVDRSIQRIQGRDRLTLEKVRRQARFATMQIRRTRAERRYEETDRRESRVLRRRVELDAGTLLQPTGADAPTEGAAPPVPDGIEAAPAVPPAAPAASEEENLNELFGGAPADATPPSVATPDDDAPSVDPESDAGNDDPLDIDPADLPPDDNPFDTDQPPADANAAVPETTAAPVPPGSKVKAGALIGILGRAIRAVIPQPPMVFSGSEAERSTRVLPPQVQEGPVFDPGAGGDSGEAEDADSAEDADDDNPFG